MTTTRRAAPMSEGKRYKWTREKMVPVEWGPYMNYLDHLAALRRAKAEVWREAKQYVERQIQLGADFIGGPDPNIQRRVALLEVIEYCDEHIATLLDARAAQIEEGA